MKHYLTADIRLILDTFPQQTQLSEKEKIVLKTILIMQSIDQRLGGTLPILKPTDQNLSYAFEGDEGELDASCKSIAKALVKKGVLIENPIGDGKKVYSAAVLAGDSAKIEAYKKDIREKQGSTAKLISEGPAVATTLSLPPALKLRYALDFESGRLPVVAMSDFKKVMDALKNKDVDWHFYAVLALAKTDEEAQSFRTLIKKTIADNKYVVVGLGEYLALTVGDYKGTADAGMVLCGNIRKEIMDADGYENMFVELPVVFHESALIERFHGFIKGWNIPRMKDDLKVNGWDLNSEYFCSIMHELRSDMTYRSIVDEYIIVPEGADTRDTEAVKRIAISELNRTNIPYIRNGGDDTLPGLLSLSFPRKDGEAILHRMDLMGISISTGAACNSVNTEISHVLRTIQVDDIVAKGTIRVSLGKNNTKEDIENIVVALTKILTCLR